MVKRRYLMTLAVLIPYLGFTQSKTFTLNGKISDLKTGDKIFVIKGEAIDSMTVDKPGSFALKGDISGVLKTTIMSGKSMRTAYKNAIALYIEPGEIDIISNDSLKNATVQGGEANQHYANLRSSLKQVEDIQASLNANYSKLKSLKNQDTTTIQQLDQKRSELSEQRRAAYLNFLRNNSDSPIAIDVIKLYAGYFPDYDMVYPIFSKLSSSVKSSEAGLKYAVELKKYEATSIGKLAPDFQQADTSGTYVKLGDFRGNYVLIDFWASWCGPCRAENPNLLKAYTHYQGKGFTIVGISLDALTAKKAWLKAIADDKIGVWSQLSDLQGWKNDVAVNYAVQAIPTNYLISPDGKIVAKNLRGKALESKLSELLGQ